MIAEKFIAFKKKIKEIAEELKRDNLLSTDSYNEIITDLDKEKIVIGIVGQIKNGKTTLVNALIFGEPVLPAAATPMTASLTRIVFGERPSVEVDFFSEVDWNKIEEMAKESGDSEEVRYAKEILDRAKGIKKELPSILGRKKEIDFKEIYNYVGEDGKYVPATKALTIRYPNEILKDIEIVDTPGLNDPIISREMRTKEFLREADVIILLLYAGRPFDANDRDIIFNRISSEGAGKVVILMNKKDVVMQEQGTEERAKEYIKRKLKEELETLKKEQKNEIIIKVLEEAKVIPFSSLMALLGKMNKEDIEKDENLKYYYEKFKDEFPGLKTSQDFLSLSGLKELEEEIDKIIKKHKYQIFIKNVATKLRGMLKEKIDDLEQKINILEIEEKSLSKTQQEIKKEIVNLKLVEKEVIDFLYEKLNELKNYLSSSKNQIEKSIWERVYQFWMDINENIPEKGWLETHGNYSSKVTALVNKELTKLKKYIRNELNSYQNNCLNKVKLFMNDLYNEVNKIAQKYLTWSKEDIYRFMEKFREETFEKFNIKLPNVKIETSGWWFIGTAEAKQEAISQVKKATEEITNQLIECLVNIHRDYYSKIQYIETDFEKQGHRARFRGS